MQRPPRKSRLLARWGGHAHVAVAMTRHEIAYRWTAPRSPAVRALALPLFLGAGLLLLLLAVLFLAAFLLVASVIVGVLAVASILRLIADRTGRTRRNRLRS